MNILIGTISHIESSEHMSLVEVNVRGDIFSAIVLETPSTADYLRTGASVTLLFKETEVSIARNLSGEISLRNRFKAVVGEVERSKILTKVVLKYKNESVAAVITTRSADRLKLAHGDAVEWLVKTSEVSLDGGTH